MEKNRFQIVVLEDNRADLHIIRESILQAGIDCEVKAFDDGRETIRHINSADSRVPDLIILDLNIPGAEGPAVLNSVRSNIRWAHVPVFIFTASQDPADMDRARKLGSDRYLIKPGDLDGFVRFGRDVKDWLEGRRYREVNGTSDV